MECVPKTELSCDQCQFRIENNLEYLGKSNVVDYWVKKLTESSFCEVYYNDLQALMEAKFFETTKEINIIHRKI